MKHFLLSTAFALASFCTACAENWPGFRGPRGDGTSNETGLPTQWSPTENIRWKLKLPSPGNASPVVWGSRVFIAQSLDKEGTQRSLMCIDRKDGKALWTKTVEFKGKEPTHATNPYCSGTPATDGERVIVSHGSAGLYCYDFSGKELWNVDLGALIHIWGNSSSPVLWNDLVILNCGPGERTALRAFDKRTGKEVWKHEEPGKSGENKNEWIGSWSTPRFLKQGDSEQLIQSWPNAVKAHDPKTGEVIWNCSGLTKLVYTSPLVSPDVVVAMSGYGGSAIAVKTGGKGDVTETHRLWVHTKGIPQRIGSGILLGDHVYMANAGPGHIQCIEWKTGKDLWEKQALGANHWGSLVLAEGRLYATDQNGDTYVIKAEPKFEQIARNRIGEHVNSSLAVSDGEIFIRTFTHLWCIGKK